MVEVITTHEVVSTKVYWNLGKSIIRVPLFLLTIDFRSEICVITFLTTFRF